MLAGARRPGFGRLKFEWPTWVALTGCYTIWGLALANHATLGWFIAIPAALAVAFHSSLQHEVLHGHPTRSSVLNEALVFLPIGLFIPYRRFRALHLRHHNDERLTDPYDDPESFYLTEGDWTRASGPMHWLLRFNATFAGRMLIGPALGMWGFWRDDLRLILAGNRRIRGAWIRHAIGLVPVLALIWLSGMEFWFYVLVAAWPGMSLIMVRSYIEHRAAQEAPERTAIVESNWFWQLLFLNNNFHVVHHDYPALPWYRIPERWRAGRDALLAREGAYYLPGYGAVVRRWLLRGREPVVHPYFHRGDEAKRPESQGPQGPQGGGSQGPRQPVS